MPSYGIRKRRRPARESTVPRRPSRLRYLVRVPCGAGRSGARPYPAVELLQDRVAVLVALLVVTDHPELFGGEAGDLTRDLVDVQAVVVVDREPRLPQALLGVGEGDVEELGIGAHDLLGHLLEGLLLLLGLLLEGLPLLLGLLHPLLGRLLQGLLLLLGLAGDVRTRGVQELHVGLHHLLGHLLACLLLALYLFGERLQHAQPLLPGLLRRLLHRVHALLCHIRSLLVGLTLESVVPVLGRIGTSPVRRPYGIAATASPENSRIRATDVRHPMGTTTQHPPRLPPRPQRTILLIKPQQKRRGRGRFRPRPRWRIVCSGPSTSD